MPPEVEDRAGQRVGHDTRDGKVRLGIEVHLGGESAGLQEFRGPLGAGRRVVGDQPDT